MTEEAEFLRALVSEVVFSGRSLKVLGPVIRFVVVPAREADKACYVRVWLAGTVMEIVNTHMLAKARQLLLSRDVVCCMDDDAVLVLASAA